MVLCERCNTAFHKDCAADHQEPVIHAGPWVCKTCRGEMIVGGCEDIMWDFGVMEYLFCGTLPESLDERERILKVSADYRAHGNDLQRKVP